MANAKQLDVMRIALQQYGYTESPAGSNRTKYGKAFGMNGQPWCFIYEWWCGDQAKGDNPFPHNANAAYGQDDIVNKKGGKWVMKKTASNAVKKEGLKKAKFGDCIDFDFGKNNKYRQHTALCVGVRGEYYYCIEGNTSATNVGSQSNGGGVFLRKRHYKQVCSIARPKYTKSEFYDPTKAYTGKLPELPKRGYFKYGDNGGNVGKLQKALAWANGYDLKADKKFGGFTFAEVVIFQLSQGLTPNGLFDTASMKAMRKLIKSKKSKTDTQTTPQNPTESVQTDEKPKEDTVVNEVKKLSKSNKVLDVSAWQGKISLSDWKKVIKDGITCVILRSSYTEQKSFSMHEDKVFDHNIKTAIQAGMNIGIYHYSQAITEAEAAKEAEFTLKTIKAYKKHINLPVAFDWEFGGRLSAARAKKNGKAKNTAICDAFCNKVKKAGYDTMVYANLSTLNGYLSANLYKTWKIWVAQYNKTCDYKHPWYLWQYTSSGKSSGISGKLDVSKFRKEDEKKEFFPERGYFQKGDKGENVKEVQKMLIKANAGAHWTIEVTGIYDDKTEKFVKLLQDARHMVKDGKFGEKCLKQCEKKVTLQMKAINRGVSVARSSKYVYGVGERAHRYGDPFSKTNTGPVMKKKEKKGEPHYVNAKGKEWKEGDGEKYTYENTMCCNPFATVCYAYGAEIAKVLKAAKAGSGGGTSPDTWTRYGFKTVGKCKDVKFSDLKKGDLVMKEGHVWVYTGGDWMVEASSEGWGKGTIAHKTGAKKRYESYRKIDDAYVVRYPES